MSGTVSSRRYLIEILLFTTYLVFGISWLAYAQLMPELMEAYDFSKAEGGSLISFVSFAKAFVPLFAGALAARLGLKNAMLAGSVFAALAVAVPFLPTYQALLVGRFLFGMGGAVIVTLIGPIVMTWFPKEELPVVTGLNNVAVNTGITVATFITVPVSKAFGWQNTLIGFGALCALMAVLWAVLGGVGPIKREVSAATAETQPSIGEMIRKPETWWLSLAFAGPLCIYLALNAWFPAHLEQAFGLDRAAASKLTSLFNAVGIPVAILSGWLCKKLGKRRPLIIIAGLLMPVSSWVMVTSIDPSLRIIGAVGLGASLFLYVAPLFTIPMELPGMDSSRVALMMGCIFSLAYCLSTLSPIITGYLADQYGSYAMGLKFFSLTSVMLAVGGFMLPETGQGARNVSSS